MIRQMAMFVLFAVPATCAAQEAVPSAADLAAAAVRVVSLDEATNHALVRAMPLKVAIPRSFKLFPDQPYPGNWLWTSQKSYDTIEKDGKSDGSEGLLQLRISTQIGYDRASDAFICGPGCGQAQIVKQMNDAGFRVQANERRTVNGVPAWFLEATAGPPGAPSQNLYLAYLATLMDTNVVVLTWGPPLKDPARGERVWTAIKQTLMSSPRDPRWEAMLNRPARRTPPIGKDTKLPPATARVTQCIDRAIEAAGKLGYTIDAHRRAEGLLRVISGAGDQKVTLTLRFVDFGDEIILASSSKGSGTASERMPEVERSYYSALHDVLDPALPIVGSEDMVENMVLLPNE
jgi:hypothetical protein